MMNEQELEDQCIGWFQEAGWRFVHGPDIAPEGMNAERADYRQVILRDRLLAALARINPHIPPAALILTWLLRLCRVVGRCQHWPVCCSYFFSFMGRSFII
ncbi:MAG: hypothetical protein RL300_1356 [Pseudomonadota bacterium]